MFLACHLFFGLVLGLALAGRTGDRRLIGFAALGALIPDLIDKPIGHILFAETLDSGRLFGHGLLFVGILLAAGLISYRRRDSFAILAVAAGVFSHQILDAMWAMPVTWYFPLLGPYEPQEYINYFGGSLLAEVSSLSEWIFLAASAGIVLAVSRGLSAAVVRVSAAILGLLAILSLALFAAGSPESVLMAGAGSVDYLLLAVVAAAGVIVVSRLHRGGLIQDGSAG